jgi:hypothetical protein
VSIESIIGDTNNKWNDKLRRDIVASFSRDVNEEKAKQYLSKFKWPLGLQNTLIKTCKRVPLRFFIVDDSGSMNINDGQRVLQMNESTDKLIRCTRWAEVADSMKFHVGLADALGSVAEFRTLNTCKPVIIGLELNNEEKKCRAIENFEEEEPHGQTPLCEHITKVVVLLQSVANELKESGQMACVIIATDGLATDGDIVEAMKPLTSVSLSNTCTYEL